jgi:ATP-binding cassette, subfamily B, bacterial
MCPSWEPPLPSVIGTLVGQTGAGKSTLVKLIARFYDVTSGSVAIDGLDVREYDLPRYRQQLGVVPHEPYLFAGTVRTPLPTAGRTPPTHRWRPPPGVSAR